MKAGWKQLNRYKEVLDRKTGFDWKTVLDTY
ncbi:hypothetical protein [Dyadobacter sp. LHD-138]